MSIRNHKFLVLLNFFLPLLFSKEGHAGLFDSLIDYGVKKVVDTVSPTQQQINQGLQKVDEVQNKIKAYSDRTSKCPRGGVPRTRPSEKFTEAAKKPVCNGSSYYCDRAYDTLTYVTAHNGASNISTDKIDVLASLSQLRLECYGNINDQKLSLAEQFRLGVRAFKVPVHNLAYHSDVRGCHGRGPSALETICSGGSSCKEMVKSFVEPCYLDPSARSIEAILSDVKRFLDENPNEVMTVFLEDQTERETDIQLLYTAIDKSKIGNYLLPYDSNRTEWPTLGTMIRNKTRLVLFLALLPGRSALWNTTYTSPSGKGTLYKYFHPIKSLLWQSTYDFGSLEKLAGENPTSFPEKGKMWVLQHFVTPWLGGDPGYAFQANDYDFLKQRADKYIQGQGRNPTFIWVDFVQLSKDGSKDVFSYVDSLNDEPAIKENNKKLKESINNIKNVFERTFSIFSR